MERNAMTCTLTAAAHAADAAVNRAATAAVAADTAVARHASQRSGNSNCNCRRHSRQPRRDGGGGGDRPDRGC